MTAKLFRKGAFAIAFLALSQCVQAGGAVNLITDAEFAQEKQFSSRRTRSTDLTSKPVAGAPVIELKKPKVQETLKAPFPIQLVFKPGEDAEVVPDSFKVLYGFMKLDITDRVVQNAKVTKEGIFVDQANIPAGSHKLVLQIRDSKNRKAETVMSFNVE